MLDKLKEYKKYIIDYDLMTKASFRQNEKLRLYIRCKDMRRYSYILIANSIQELNNEIESLFSDDLEVNTSIEDILLKEFVYNKDQLKLF